MLHLHVANTERLLAVMTTAAASVRKLLLSHTLASSRQTLGYLRKTDSKVCFPTDDHIVPPYEGVAADDSPCHVPYNCTAQPFDFRRLGIRVSAMLLSPWVPKNMVIKEPTGPMLSSQYDITSGIATAKRLFNLSTFLTKRDAWVGVLLFATVLYC